ncbi:MAG: SUMF1/EgtB/PvdO family nonheme iron enzyme, partial [Planctomycetales bacterium]|nr:SUMF1/EgtB/PvdO family nonheme iron enzyme [Planctomycetales bacterium]
DLTQRYQSALAMADDLRRFVNRYEISARRVRSLGRAVRWCRRNRTVATLAAMLLLVVTTALAGLVGLHLKRERVLTNGLAVIDSHLASNNDFGALREISRLREEFGNRHELRTRYESIGREVVIDSDYSKATIQVKPIESPDADWLELGSLTTSPLKVRLPYGSLLARVTQPNLEDHEMEIVRSNDSAYRVLAPTHSGMVRVTPITVWRNVPWRRMQKFPDLSEYSIDRYEVTNGEFYRFVLDGGYGGDGREEKWWVNTLGAEWKNAVSEFVDKTGEPGPKFWQNGKYPAGMEDYPVVGVSWYEAMAYAKWAGKQLPTVYHWLEAAEFTGDYLPLGVLSRSNIGGRDVGRRANRDPHSLLSVNPYGAFDMAGNVKEWCLNEEADSRRFAMGGSWQDDPKVFHEPIALSAFERCDDTGFRCALYEKSNQLASAHPIQWRSFAAVRDTLPQLEDCRDQFEYPKDKPWATKKLEPVSIDGIHYQAFQIDTVNNQDDRMLLYVAYPPMKGFVPPYETVVVGTFLGFDANRGVPKWIPSDSIATFLNRGRAVVIPVLFGTGDRIDWENRPPFGARPDQVDAYGRTVVNIAKDFSRTIDFIEQFEEATGIPSVLDKDRMAYCGIVYGGCAGPIWMVADYLTHDRRWRVKAAVLTDAFLTQCLQPPEVDQMAYLPHLTVPTMMLNCRLISTGPYDRAQKPMYELLPLPDDQKVLKAFPQYTHGIPAADFGIYANRWLDDHLRK